ncbi:MAG: hypothetical protein ICV53_17330 [Flavisolibacter sp.]|nr:hypothetical protein [Flavisolibacter sp.]MBD0352395.1 hypothetical protein [Flavisolibacter sp.]MBD0367850.1 hypothetical protein [Flavisolibacter sp.]
MKKLSLFLFLTGILAACTDSGKSINITIDSTTTQKVENKLDTLGEQIEEKAKDLKNRIEIGVKKGRDSANIHTKDSL